MSPRHIPKQSCLSSEDGAARRTGRKRASGSRPLRTLSPRDALQLLRHALDTTLQIAKGNAERRHRFQERVRVEKDIDALYESLRIKAASTALTEELFVQRVKAKLAEHAVSKRNRFTPTALRDVFLELARALYGAEGLTDIKRPDYASSTTTFADR